LYPTLTSIAASIINDSNSNNDKTVITSNLTASQLPSRIHPANAMMINPTHVIVDTGTTFLFVMEGTNCKNKHIAINPIIISLPDGKKVSSTHICNVTIPSLPFTLIGHIVPEMMMASLLRICVLCKAGCQVNFDDKKCEVIYKGKVILTGFKDPTSNLWTLPIFPEELCTTPSPVPVSRCMIQHKLNTDTNLTSSGPSIDCTPQLPQEACHIAGFLYHRTTKANDVKFMHQSLCNPPISSLLQAIKRNFLKGAPSPRKHGV
jgi:hypothetical protein